MLTKARELLATVFFIGYLPGAPGTWASVAAAAVFIILGRPLDAEGWLILLGLVVLSMFALSRAEEVFGSRDPRPAVLDEFAGMWLAFLVGGSPEWAILAVGFIFFRMFDIAKPFPIRRCERLPGWRGILADDLCAGLFAGIIARVAASFVYR